MDERATLLGRETLYEGRIFTLVRDRVRLPGGHESRLDVVRHPGSVVLLPMPDPAHIVLIRQYRYPVNRWLWELPAGSLQPGEDPLDAARRECHEEIGLVPARIEPLGVFYPTPGYCTERMIFFRLTDLGTPPAAAKPDPDELIEPRVFALQAARELVRGGEIVDMKTALGLSLL